MLVWTVLFQLTTGGNSINNQTIQLTINNQDKNHGSKMKNNVCGGSLDVEYNALQNQARF